MALAYELNIAITTGHPLREMTTLLSLATPSGSSAIETETQNTGPSTRVSSFTGPPSTRYGYWRRKIPL
jgi:hypothetical protein